MASNILTPVKWTGSKRTQAKRIIANFPDKIDLYRAIPWKWCSDDGTSH